MVGTMAPYARVLITGASSGIGAALALELAAPGTTLHLSGRDAGRLAGVVEACRARGAVVQDAILDVRDAAAMAAWVTGCGSLDLVVANAGISAGAGEKAAETAEQTRAIFATNLDGVLNTVLPAIDMMRDQPAAADGWRGRIVVVASIAAFVAGAAAPAYCASKAAADAWTVATAVRLRREGIALTSVCPGYIRTAMTARNRFPDARADGCGPRGTHHPARGGGGADPDRFSMVDRCGRAGRCAGSAARRGRLHGTAAGEAAADAERPMRCRAQLSFAPPAVLLSARRTW